MRSDQPFEGRDVANNDSAFTKINQALPVPLLQLLVETFPASTCDMAELSLGDAKFDG